MVPDQCDYAFADGRAYPVGAPYRAPALSQLYPDAPCDGIPYEGGWFLMTLLFSLLALWGLLASSITTFFAFKVRTNPKM
jgi:hypothetical protein